MVVHTCSLKGSLKKTTVSPKKYHLQYAISFIVNCRRVESCNGPVTLLSSFRPGHTAFKRPLNDSRI